MLMRNLGSRHHRWSGYDAAQICENGHVINWFAESSPQKNQDYCTACGTLTLKTCSHCQQTIRGYLHTRGVVRHVPSVAPSFCHKCGTAYPWTEKGIKAAKDLIAEAEKLSPEEKEALSKSLDDIVCDTPSTQAAVIRFKKFLPKTGKEIAEALRSIVVDVASEAAKKLLWPST